MGRALPIPTFLVDEGRFLLRVLRSPRDIGAVAPSSKALARAMAGQIPEDNGPILELGPGTGAVTAAILAHGVAASRLTAIEYDRGFADLIARRFPEVKVVCGDAFDIARTLGPNFQAPYAAIVSSVPLLNFSMTRRTQFLAQALAVLAPGAPFIQFSYGLKPSVPPPAGASVVRAARIIFNIPPARVWVYRSQGS